MATSISAQRGVQQIRKPIGQRLFSRPSDDPRKAIVEANSSNDDLGITVGDLLAINFTVSKIAYDSPYLVSFGDDQLYLRIFQIMPTEEGRSHLFMKQSGTFEKLGPELLSKMEVHGELTAIYNRR